MQKLTACIALFCFISITIADDCNNPLLTTFRFSKLDQPTTVEGLRYCRSLQKGKSCCSAETVNTIQDKAKTLADRLTQVVATRDRAIVDTRDRVIPGLQQSLNKLTANAAKAMQKMAELAGQNPQNPGENGGGAETLSMLAMSMQGLSQQASNNLPMIKAEFKNFQKARVSCVVGLIKLQSAAWCLACDPAYATKGVAAGSITLSDTVCKRLQSSCFNFITGSVVQSAMLSIRAASSMIDTMATVLEKVANNDLSGLEALGSLFEGLGAADSAVVAVAQPDGCTSATQCSWICNNFFTATGQVDETALSIGGVANDLSSIFGGANAGVGGNRRLSEEEEETVVKNKLQKKRILTSNEWNPSEDEAGVTVTFAEDPANVGNNSSGVLKSGLVCLVGMMIALLF